jgi:arylsulfatase A-like enzyme
MTRGSRRGKAWVRGWLLSLALGLAASPGADALEGRALPNIVLILADDLGWGDVGYHGSLIKTPVLDQLAKKGVVLSQFHAQPTCSPTRAALLTGQAPIRFGISQPLSKLQPKGLELSARTLADYLKSAGYQTFLIGKWHLGPSDYAYHPLARGFDHFYGNLTGGVGYWDHVHGGGLDWQRNGQSVREQGYSTHLLAAEAERLLRTRDRDRPFFLYASFNAPHLPNEAPPEAVAAYGSFSNPFRRTHAAMVSEFDRALGQLVATLKAEGLEDNTLLWFMSDNGGLIPELGPRPLVGLAKLLDALFDGPVPQRTLEFIRVNTLEGGSDNGLLREGKGSVYEGGVRVPSLLYWPGTLSPSTHESFISVQDVTPTLLSLVGLGAPGSFDGVNQWPALAQQGEAAPADYLVLGWEGEAFYRWPWKLLALGEETFELYNLQNDPLERTDLAAVHPERVRALDAARQRVPRADSIHLPLGQVLSDMDFFGGAEDRPPWAEQMKGSPYDNH